ncbi:MAG: TolC family outer membrane protein [Magnetococcales bacterium]|nr:TolC family outer membrane protein [Magnetococcales bacterium]NGZ06076.1 TolC family outer membrane protein [Magnetococcales bacterium]
MEITRYGWGRSGQTVIKRAVGIAVTVCLWSGMAWAAPEANDPFVAAMEAALGKNPKVVGAAAQLRSAMERLPQARAQLKPTVDFNASLTHNHISWNSGDSSADAKVYGLSLTQPLYNPKAMANLRLSRPFVAASEQDLQAAIQGVFLEAATTVVEVLQAREVVRLAKNNRELLQHHLDATRSRFKVGEITRTDVSQAEARLAQAEATQVRAENTLAVNRARFQEVVGSAVPEGLRLPGFRERLEDLTLSELQIRSADRPELLAALLRSKVAEEDIELKRAGHLPSISLNARANRSNDEEISGTTDPLNKYTVDVGLSVPLYAGGMVVSQTAESVARKEAQDADLERLRFQVNREVASARLDLHSARAADKALETALRAANDALDGVEREYQVGTRTALDLLDARNEAFSAQTELARSRFGIVLSGFRLLYAVGRLNLDALTLNAPQPGETPTEQPKMKLEKK